MDNILEILVCPLCKGKLLYDKDKQELICNFDKLAYPISANGIPIMMSDRARDIKAKKDDVTFHLSTSRK